MVGSISSSTVRNGNYGIYFNSASGSTLTSNNVYSNSAVGISLGSCSNDILTSNNVFANGNNGIYLTSSSKNILTSNSAYSNGSRGIRINGSSNNTLTSNSSYSNSNYGIELDVNVNNNTVTSNNSYANVTYGIYLTGASNSIFTSNNSYLNSGYGIADLVPSSNNMFTLNSIYSNTSGGIAIGALNGDRFVDGRLGYNAAGVSLPDTAPEIHYTGSSVVTLTLKNTRVNPLGGIDTSGINMSGTSLVSYNQDLSTGTVQIYGDYNVTGSTLTLDYAANVYSSTASAPKQMFGSNAHTAAVNTTYDAKAVTQLITITYRTSDNLFHVDGSVSGPNMITFSGTQSNLDVPASPNSQFNMNFTVVGTPADGDSVDFALISASSDTNRQKKILFGNSDPALNNGRSKLSIDSPGGFVLRGISGTPSLMDRISGSSTYYSFVSTGAFTIQEATITNTDAMGIQLSGNAGIFMSSVTFDSLGFGAGSSTSAYITARSLASTATFTNINFNLSRSSFGVAAYNIQPTVSASSLQWRIATGTGAFWGESYDDDSLGDKVKWGPNTDVGARYWIATVAGNWSNSANWGYVSNDFGGAPAPTVGQTAIFDGAAGANGTSNVDTTVNIATLTVSGYSGSINTQGFGVTLSAGLSQTSGTISLGTSTVSVGGNFARAGGTFTAGTSTVTFNGAGIQTLSGSTTFYALKALTSGATLQFTQGTTQYVTNMVDWENIYLRSTSNNATWYFALTGSSQTLKSLDVKDSNASGGNTMFADVASTNSGNNTNWNFGTGLADTWTGTVDTDWNKGGNWNTGAVPRAVDDVVIPNTTNKPQLTLSVAINSLNISGAATALDLNNFNLIVSTYVTFVGTITARGAEQISVGGNWTNGGLFNAANSVVLFDGSGAQTVDQRGQIFGNVTSSNTAAGGLTFISSFTAAGFSATTAGLSSSATIYFAGNSTFTISTFTVNGTSSYPVVLRSTSGTAQWYLTNTSENDVTHVDVSSSNANAGVTVLALNSTDSGSNNNWNFGTPATVIWTGATSTDFGTPTNWSTNFVPRSFDDVVIANAGHLPAILDQGRTLDSLTISTGAALVLNNFNLTLSTYAVISGTLTASGGELVSVGGNWTNAGLFTAARSTVAFSAESSVSACRLSADRRRFMDCARSVAGHCNSPRARPRMRRT